MGMTQGLEDSVGSCVHRSGAEIKGGDKWTKASSTGVSDFFKEECGHRAEEGSFTWNAAGHQAREMDGRQDSVEVTEARKEAVSKQRSPNGINCWWEVRKTGVDLRSTTFSEQELIGDLQGVAFLG